MGEPSDSIVVDDLAPFARDVWSRDGDALANVDSDVAWVKAVLSRRVQHHH